jgi:hypothetical protein
MKRATRGSLHQEAIQNGAKQNISCSGGAERRSTTRWQADRSEILVSGTFRIKEKKDKQRQSRLKSRK